MGSISVLAYTVQQVKKVKCQNISIKTPTHRLHLYSVGLNTSIGFFVIKFVFMLCI